MTEAGTHVPWVASWPGTIQKGSVNQQIYEFSVFLPTFAELMQADVSMLQLDGRSIVPDLQGATPIGAEMIYEFYKPLWGKFTPGEFVRTVRYKLNDDGKYFDIEVDATEANNLEVGTAGVEGEKVRLELQNLLDKMGVRDLN